MNDELRLAAIRLRDAQKAYMAVRDNKDIREPYGQRVAEAAEALDDVLSRAPSAPKQTDGWRDGEDVINTVRKALHKAQMTFEHYSELHFKKGTEEGTAKGMTNLEHADAMEEALLTLDRYLVGYTPPPPSGNDGKEGG